MAIPVFETLVTFLAQSAGATTDEWDGPAAYDVTVVQHVRAVIGTETGSEKETGGMQEDVLATLTCDPFHPGTYAFHNMRVLDETTGLTWEVVWARARYALGLDHISGALRMVTGEPT